MCSKCDYFELRIGRGKVMFLVMTHFPVVIFSNNYFFHIKRVIVKLKQDKKIGHHACSEEKNHLLTGWD